jgi:hypothetical protein
MKSNKMSQGRIFDVLIIKIFYLNVIEFDEHFFKAQKKILRK